MFYPIYPIVPSISVAVLGAGDGEWEAIFAINVQLITLMGVMLRSLKT